MANTAEGITVGGEDGLDPNDPASFAEIMEGRGVPKADGDDNSPDRSIASGLTTTAEPGPASGRDPETGKFVSNQETKAPPAVAPVQTTDTSGAGGDASDDPDVSAFLSKYGGDVDEALKAAAHAQSLIGKQGAENGELKERLARLEGRLEQMAATPPAPAAAPPSDDQVTEVASTAIESRGYAAAATEAANIAHTQGDERQYRAVLEQWAIEDPVSMADFNTDFRLWQRDQRNQPETVETPAWQVKAEEQIKVDQYGESLVALKTELGDQAFAIVASKLEDALEQMPPNVLAMIDSTDPEARAAGFGIVADRATLLAAKAGATPPPVVEGVPAAVERKLSGARVASGALRPAEKSGEKVETTREEAIKDFKRQIVEADTTSVASGLTYGPQP